MIGMTYSVLPPTMNGPVRIAFNHRECHVVPVALLDGSVVRYLCADHDEPLPVNYDCDDCMWVETISLDSASDSYALGRPCSRHI